MHPALASTVIWPMEMTWPRSFLSSTRDKHVSARNRTRVACVAGEYSSKELLETLMLFNSAVVIRNPYSILILRQWALAIASFYLKWIHNPCCVLSLSFFLLSGQDQQICPIVFFLVLIQQWLGRSTSASSLVKWWQIGGKFPAKLNNVQ
jgi:hypothetical protein